jgi:hypothetical protein
MPRFSERHGLVPARSKIQMDELDARTRTRLWNVFRQHVIVPLFEAPNHAQLKSGTWQHSFFASLWDQIFALPGESLPQLAFELQGMMSKVFQGNHWGQVMDIVEFAGFAPEHQNAFNTILETELVGYRFIGKRLTPLTNPQQIQEIERALDVTGEKDGLRGANVHLNAALALFSDRTAPDYRTRSRSRSPRSRWSPVRSTERPAP